MFLVKIIKIIENKTYIYMYKLNILYQASGLSNFKFAANWTGKL